jgi:hypothetical protein
MLLFLATFIYVLIDGQTLAFAVCLVMPILSGSGILMQVRLAQWLVPLTWSSWYGE